MKRSLIPGLAVILIPAIYLFAGGKSEENVIKANEISYAIHTAPNTIEHKAAQKLKEIYRSKKQREICHKTIPRCCFGRRKRQHRTVKSR